MEPTDTLQAAEDRRTKLEDVIADLKRKHTNNDEQIASTRRRLQQFNDLASSDINATTLVNHERSKRHLAALEALRGRIEEDLATAKEKLRAATLDTDRARIPGIVTEASAQVGVVRTAVEKTRADLAAALQRLHRLKTDADKLAASTHTPLRWDPVTLAWSAVSGSETGCSLEVGMFADRLLVEIAKALYSVSRITESARTEVEHRARETEQIRKLAAMTEQERLSAIRESLPGWGIRGAPRRAPDDLGAPTDEDREMLRRFHEQKQQQNGGVSNPLLDAE